MNNKVFEKLIEHISPAVDSLCQELEKYYPGVSIMKYETGGDATTFAERLHMGIYVELIRAGLIT